ncbi:MAG TPA: enoyl-CoA hydratase-related protein [Gammaproteobacteria bacterium]|nr:enoyl-CoA hydratase-related protein [Gammaproteobacteria bacterium]
MSELIKTEIQEHILIITITRSEKLNALTQKMYHQLNEAFDELNQNPNVRVGLLHGEGDHFTAGNDLQDFLQAKNPEDLPHVVTFLQKLNHLDKPLVAALKGCAIGIGTTLLSFCDLVYASKDAYFQLPFINLGIIPEAGSTEIFPRLIGYRKAAEYMFLGEKFSAADALRYGLINAIIEEQDVVEFALQQAKKLAEKSPEALCTTKRLLRHTEKEIIDQAIERENHYLFKLLLSAYTKKNLQAFFANNLQKN